MQHQPRDSHPERTAQPRPHHQAQRAQRHAPEDDLQGAWRRQWLTAQQRDHVNDQPGKDQREKPPVVGMDMHFQRHLNAQRATPAQPQPRADNDPQQEIEQTGDIEFDALAQRLRVGTAQPPASSAVSSICCACATVEAIGFSQSTCNPAFKAAMVIG